MSATPIIVPTDNAEKNQADDDRPDENPIIDAVVEPSVDISDVVSKTRPFKDLSAPIVEAIVEGAECREYAAEQTVFSMGQFDGADAFIVASGKMRVSVIDSETGAVIVDEIGKNAAFAVDLTFCGAENEVFSRLAVTAEENLVLISIDAENLRTLAGQRPSLMRNLATYFAEELGVRRFNALSAEAAPEQRVFTELLKFVERDGVSGLWRVPQMPKHRELADLAGVDEAVAANAVANLIQEGVARREYPGLVVLDMGRFNELAG